MFTNSTIWNPLFWMAMGALNLGLLFVLKLLFQEYKIRVSLLKWVSLSAYWLLLCLLMGAGFTLVGENEAKAGMRLLAFSLVPMLFIGIMIVRWILAGKGNDDSD